MSQSSKQAVQVYIRTRPTDSFASANLKINQHTGEFDVHVEKKDEGAVNNQLDNWKFKFNNIMLNTTQDDVYDQTSAQIVSNVVAGYNGTIMCYGQTGSGKTFSMLGLPNNYKQRGVIPRAVQQIYHEIGMKFDQAITIRISYAEIYNEKMVDLLAPPEQIGDKAKQLSIQDDSRGGVAVKNLSMHVCDFEEDALNMLFEGEISRKYASHEMNSHSSRSHCIYTVHIESRSRVESQEKIVFSKLHLVDLAGSERVKKTGTKGSQLVEARHINKSLSYLEQVVLALSDRKRDHVPYRQTTLTNFLRDSLGGNCKTVVIANVHCIKDHLEETISTLKFATRMMKVKNEAIVNAQMDPTLQIKRLEKEIRDLKQELAMHDTLANRGRVKYDEYSMEEKGNISQVTMKYLNGEVDDIDNIDSLRMIREIFSQIKTEYRKTSQQIESVKRQMEENPQSFKLTLEQQKLEEQKAAEEAAQKQAEEAKAAEEKEAAEGDQVEGEEEDELKKDSIPEVKQKRPPIPKQEAFIEFKTDSGKKIEEVIILSREDMKNKRNDVKDLTTKINSTKHDIDKLKHKLDKKEEERKLQSKALKNDLDIDNFDDDVEQEEIIDEEELIMLREMKDLKRAYRDNFSKLKGVKSDINSLQNNINTSKEQLIIRFEHWYIEEFDLGESGDLPAELNVDMAMGAEKTAEHSTRDGEPSPMFDGKQQKKNEDLLEDEDAAVYRRAKQAVDELHRARKFDKSIKLR